jgi:hypothetical protein
VDLDEGRGSSLILLSKSVYSRSFHARLISGHGCGERSAAVAINRENIENHPRESWRFPHSHHVPACLLAYIIRHLTRLDMICVSGLDLSISINTKGWSRWGSPVSVLHLGYVPREADFERRDHRTQGWPRREHYVAQLMVFFAGQ